MSLQYAKYLKEHISNVYNGYLWIVTHIGHEKIDAVLPEINWTNMMVQLKMHDRSKLEPEEFDGYDEYFYGTDKEKSKEEIQKDFDYAWLHHIHSNPHHWQYWVLIEDDPENYKAGKALDIPDPFIFEMICDWWTFSWKKDDLREIFNWWEDHRDKVIMTESTMDKVEKMLEMIREAIDEDERKKMEMERMGIEEYTVNVDGSGMLVISDVV